MNRAIVLIVIIGLMLSCTYDDISKVTLQGTWTAVALKDLANGTIEYKTQANSYNGELWISFDDRSNPREYEGKKISNSFGGSYTYAGQQKISILDGFVTEVGGNPPWELQFDRVFYQTEIPYTIQNDSLMIYYSNGTKAFVFQRK